MISLLPSFLQSFAFSFCLFFINCIKCVSNSYLIAANCKIQQLELFFYIKLADKSRLRGKIVCPINSLNALFQLSIKLIKQSQVTGIEIMILVNICLGQLFIYFINESTIINLAWAWCHVLSRKKSSPSESVS